MEGWEMSLKVGSTIYKRSGAPIVITGETKVSWLVGDPYEWSKVKIKKSAMRKGNSGETWVQYFVNQEDALDCVYAAKHISRIANLVSYCRDGKVLKQIAALVGYEGDK
jgi:hypothetical protein